MKKNLLALTLGFLIIFFSGKFLHAQQAISPAFSGINGWMPTQIGSVSLGGQFDAIMTTSSFINGGQGLKILRYGGIDADKDGPTTAQYQQFVNYCHSMGAEPLIQISFLKQYITDNGPTNTATTANTVATTAASIVNALKVSPYNVKYYSIGNEPDRYHTFVDGSNNPLNGGNPLSAQQIADYFKIISDAIKGADANAIVVGPDLAEPHVGNLTPLLLGSGGTKDITLISPNTSKRYCDIYAFHFYPFPTCTDPTNGCTTWEHTRQRVISSPTTDQTGYYTSLQTACSLMVNIISQNSLPTKLAVTELNCAWQNQESTGSLVMGSNGKTDISDNSFIAGQWLAEMFAVGMKAATTTGVGRVEFMVPWSVHESSGNEGLADHGILDGVSNLPTTVPKPRSTYWHEKLMSDFFKSGSSFTSTVFQGTVLDNSSNPISDVKSYAAKVGSQIVIVLINQKNSGGSLSYEIRTNSSFTPSSAINVSFSSGSTSAYTRTGTIGQEETQWIIFDCNGNFAGTWTYNVGNYQADSPPTFVSANPSAPFNITFTCGSGCTKSAGNYIDITFTGPQTQTWLVDNGLTMNIASGTDVHALVYTGTHTYTYIATNSSGCVWTQAINVIDGGGVTGFGFQAFIGGSSGATCGGNNGSATVYLSDCQGQNTIIQWDNGETTATAIHLSPGLHSVSVTCNENPVSTITLHVVISNTGSIPSVSAGPNQTKNRNCSVTLTASPNLTSYGYTYQWFKGTSTIPFSNSYTTIINAWNTSSYKVVVTAPANFGGCTNSSTMNLTVNTSQYCFIRPNNIHLSALVCNPTGNGGGNGPITIINSATTINADQVIDNTIKVTNNAKLTITESELAFASNTKIIVEPGAQLEIRDSYLHGCSNGKWDGIEITGNNNVSNQVIITGSAFVDADYTIKTDKTLGVLLDNNVFINGSVALTLERNKDFTITKNYFFNYDIGIKTKNTPIANVRSLIKENFFENVKTAVSFENDNHFKLDIKCNTFKNYTQHAILSANTILQDQGTSTSGAGNIFVSSSSLANDKLNHQGNPNMKYYYDPSNPVISGMNVSTIQSQGDGCQASVRLASDESTTILLQNVLLGILPNPATDDAIVSYSIEATDLSSTLIISNTLGQQIDRFLINSKTSSFKLDCSSYQNGIYYVTLLVNEASMGNKKLVITR